MRLPKPRLRGATSLETCIQRRRSSRNYSRAVLELDDLSQLLWAAQGLTGIGGLRTSPSAGALYPIRTYLLATAVRSVGPGLYQYDSDYHQLKARIMGRMRPELTPCKLDGCVEHAPALIVLAADYRAPRREFGDNAVRLVHIEAGHIGQNICLQATGLGVATIGLGAFDIEALRRILKLPETQTPVYVIALGKSDTQ